MKDLAKKNIYIRKLSPDNNLVYMPLCKHATVINDADLNILQHYVVDSIDTIPSNLKDVVMRIGVVNREIYTTERKISGLKNMMWLPNNRCNFNCSYCYSAFGRNGEEITISKLKTALDFFFGRKESSHERLTISILGGGEPLLSWNLIKKALDYAYSLAEKRGVYLPVSLVTNGSILSDDILEYSKRNKISISVSFDILPDIQNAQRGHYDLVVANVRRMVEYGLDVAFNTVITEANVDRMNEMILSMIHNTPGVKKVSFKSLITDSLFKDAGHRQNYYRKFVDGFYEALDLAKKNDIWLTSPYYNNALCISDRYCPGKFVVTSQGDISICHCVGSSKDKLYDKFIYGKIEQGEVVIDEEKLDSILAHDSQRNERCQTCIAHWHCAGGCYADNCTVGESDSESQDAYCESMRYFIEKFIKRNILHNDK